MSNPSAAIALSSRTTLSGSVRRAAEFLDAHWARRVTLDELSRAAYMSKFHLLRKFKEAVGVTPGQYQVLSRLARAREFLEEGLRVSAVAYRTGFSDQAHLTRAFKRTYGVTPARYAAMAAGHTADVPAWPALADFAAAPRLAAAA